MRRHKKILAGAAFFLFFAACERQPDEKRPQDPATTNDDKAAGAIVKIIARGLTFEAPKAIASGWNTFRLVNESGMEHFAILQRLPDGVSMLDQQSQVAPVFQQGMDLLNAGDHDAAMAKFGELPAWFGDIVFMGGPGFLSPGKSADATVFVEPGTYMIECYVKTNGIFHSYNPDPAAVAMVHEFEVTNDPTDAAAPRANMDIKVSSERGFEISGTPTIGSNTIAVHFVDQVAHENFVGHDIHVARVPDDFSAEALATWMNWAQPLGLETPAPVTFLGGINEMPAGTTGYFTVELEPGTHVWVAEVPDAGKKGMLEVFTVAP